MSIFTKEFYEISVQEQEDEAKKSTTKFIDRANGIIKIIVFLSVLLLLFGVLSLGSMGGGPVFVYALLGIFGFSLVVCMLIFCKAIVANINLIFKNTEKLVYFARAEYYDRNKSLSSNEEKEEE